MQPYGQLRLLGPGFWVRDGEWYGTTFRRRMVVMALSSGELIIHNPFVLKDEDLSQLKSLGKVAAVLMPNALHGDDLGWMEKALPEARVLVPEGVAAATKKKHRVDGTLEKDWPSEWSSSVICLPVAGLRFIHESVFLHKASRSLVLTDLVFNMQPEDFHSAFERVLMSWNRVGQGLGPSRLCNGVSTRSLKERQSSIETMLTWDFDRVVMNHGHIVEQGGKDLMRKAFLKF